MRLQRRSLIGRVGIGLVAAALPRAASAAPPPSSGFAGLFSDRTAARSLGQRYLASGTSAPAAARAFAASALDEVAATGTALGGVVAARIDADFAAGRIAVQDGWVLAQGELLACAALAVEA